MTITRRKGTHLLSMRNPGIDYEGIFVHVSGPPSSDLGLAHAMLTATRTSFPALGAPALSRTRRDRRYIVSKAGDASDLGPSPPPRNLRYVTKDGRPSIVPQDVPPLQSAAVGVGGAFIISAFAMWRIESNKKREREYWIEKAREQKEKEATGKRVGDGDGGVTEE